MRAHDTTNLTIAASGLLVLAGCTVGPTHTSPPPYAPQAWTESLDPGMTADAADLRAWWRSFHDPTLDALVDRALAGSLDLRDAAARVRESRALRGVTAAERLPAVDARGSAALRHSSATSEGGPGGAPGDTNDAYDVGFDASWEIDVFGRVRRGVEAADADVAAAIEDERAARVALIAEVARVYVELRSAQSRLKIAEANVLAQRETFDLAEERRRAGLGTDLDTARAAAQLESSQANLPVLRRAERVAANRLSVLLGELPGSLSTELGGAGANPAPKAGAIGLPADLLRRRPDIRRAERALAAATARVGVATADLYPRFTLAGNFGLESGSLADLVDADSRSWSVGPLAVRWPIFNGGRVRAGIRAQEARLDQALVAYERTVLTAHEEAANALLALARTRERREALAKAEAASARAAELADDLWSRGLTDFINVLDARRALYAAQDQLAIADAEGVTGLVALYKALGGGWDDSPATAAAP